MIPVFKPLLLRPTGHPILDEVLGSDWWGTGAKVIEAEASFAAWVGVESERCLMVNSCTAALHLAVKLFPGARRFLVPSLTFVSTALAPLYERKPVEFVEVGDDLCIDQDDVLRRLVVGDVVIAVHLGGHPARLDKIWDKVPIIEDCAHAFGTYDEDIHVGTQGIGCFSFQATKPLPIGDGGMLVMDNFSQRERMTALSWCGISKTTWERTTGTYHWEYSIDEIGYKYRANNLSAALLLDQFEGAERADEKRYGRALLYSAALCDISWLDIPQKRAGTCPSWQEYIIRVQARHRDRLVRHLADHGVATTVHYSPIHMYRPFWQIDDGIARPQSLPKTEEIWKQILTIPCFSGMTDEEQEKVIDGIRSFKP